jgi:hypothetical protein
MPFVFAFIFVTGALVYLNSIYTNIFQFDFTPRNNNQTAFLDTLKQKDTLVVNENKALNELSIQQPLNTDTSDLLTNFVENQTTDINSKSKDEYKSTSELSIKDRQREEDYNIWLKKTVKLIENLPPAQASKLLKNYSDNQARDIIYTMRQKQAAKIISYLEPEYVQKITRFQ